MLLISLALFIVSGYRVAAAFIASIRVDHYYFTINFLLSIGSGVLLALPISAGDDGSVARAKGESHGLIGAPAVADHSGGISFSNFASQPSSSPAPKLDLTRARSYNGPTVRPGANVPVSVPSKQVNIPLAGQSSVKRAPAQLNAQPYNPPSSNSNTDGKNPPGKLQNAQAPSQVPTSPNWPNPVDASPVISNDPVIVPASPPVTSAPGTRSQSNNGLGGIIGNRQRPSPPRYVGNGTGGGNNNRRR